jgi:hypothetical protein
MLYGELTKQRRFLLLVLLVTLYVFIGAVPAGAMDRLGLSGLAKLIEYPRLFFLTGFFAATFAALHMHTSLPNDQTPEINRA